MNETTGSIVIAVVVAVLWLAWTFFSETRHNHGILIAFLMPLTPILIPLLWIVFLLIKYTTYLAFVARGRTEDHAEFMRKLKVRSGVFLLH